jgi:hypothetical protein
MTHNQIVAALQRSYQLDDARQSRRGCYPIRKPTPRTADRRTWDDPLSSVDAPRDSCDQAGTSSEPELGSATASSRREWMSSLVNTLRRCHSTVRGLRKSCAAISGFESPSRASRAI